MHVDWAGLPDGTRAESDTHEVGSATGPLDFMSRGADGLDRDLVVKFVPPSIQPRSRAVTDGEFLAVTAFVPEPVSRVERRPREVVLLFDTSGSMAGTRLETAKRVAEHVLDGLRADDMVRVVTFDDLATEWTPAPRYVDDIGLAEVRGIIRSLTAGGGTMMARGVGRALAGTAPEGRDRLVILLSDAAIGNPRSVAEIVERDLGDTEFAVVGIGASVTRTVTEAIASLANGYAFYATLDDATDVGRWVGEWVEHASFADVEIEWGRAVVTDSVPARLPTNLPGRPLTVVTRLEGAPPAQVTVAASGFSEVVDVEDFDGFDLGMAWARLRIAEMERAVIPDNDAITALSLDWGVAATTTSFVTVDSDTGARAAGLVHIGLVVPSDGFGDGANPQGARMCRGRANAYGFLSRGAIDVVLRRHVRGLRYCYEHALIGNHSLAGSVDVTFTIGADGRVLDVWVAGEAFEGTDVLACVEGELGRMQFDQPDGGHVEVSQTLVFRQLGGPGRAE